MATLRTRATCATMIFAIGCAADVVTPDDGASAGGGGSGGNGTPYTPPPCDELVAREVIELTPATPLTYFSHVAALAEEEKVLLFHREAVDDAPGSDTISVQAFPAWANWPVSPSELPAQSTVEGSQLRDNLALGGPIGSPSLAYLSNDQVWLFPDAHDRTDGVLAVEDYHLEARLRFLASGSSGHLIGLAVRDYNDEQEMTFQLRVYSLLASGETISLPIAACSGGAYTGSAVALSDGSYLVAGTSAVPYGECTDDVTDVDSDRLQLLRYSPSLEASVLTDVSGFSDARVYPRPGGAWLVSHAIDGDWVVSRLDESGSVIDEHELGLPTTSLLAGAPMDERLMLALRSDDAVYIQLMNSDGSLGASGGKLLPGDELEPEGFRMLADPRGAGALLIWNQEPNMTIAVSRFDCMPSP